MEEVSLMEIVKQLKNCCFWREDRVVVNFLEQEPNN